MSNQARGFIRNERFGSGQVIPGTNREVTRKWVAALGFMSEQFSGPRFVVEKFCQCGKTCCGCVWCTKLMNGKCAECAGISGVKRA